MIGLYIETYETKGEDRANYGDELFSKLELRLKKLGLPNCNKSRLYRYRDFYRLYPQIVATLSPQLRKMLPSNQKAMPQPLSCGGGCACLWRESGDDATFRRCHS